MRGCYRLTKPTIASLTTAALISTISTQTAVDAFGVAGAPDHDADVVTLFDQLTGDVGAEKAVGADDQLRHYDDVSLLPAST
jgi:hypothetical protein